MSLSQLLFKHYVQIYKLNGHFSLMCSDVITILEVRILSLNETARTPLQHSDHEKDYNKVKTILVILPKYQSQIPARKKGNKVKYMNN